VCVHCGLAAVCLWRKPLAGRVIEDCLKQGQQLCAFNKDETLDELLRAGWTRERIIKRTRESVLDTKEGDSQVDLGSVSFRDRAGLRESNRRGPMQARRKRVLLGRMKCALCS
jgi:hypothetical protein